ncbi:hypothetical protein T265_02167 [Opisthorchis viverrini]|uniref:Uncharacterized protein n=1 Tax=Opisthorchis viverrini TaxID=6198 RepID=A0A075A0B0_OPIVI|nr:hypothetical protein T265_02167 [Opisthorchis viverrini]KER31662.1 hypothetical protein T265_02167 [Opisthorchis viverrini]
MKHADDQHYDEDSLHSHRLSETDRLLQIHEECLKTSAFSSIDEHPSAESSKKFASYYVVSTMHFASQMTLVDDQHYDEDSLHSHRLSGTDRLLQIHEECLKTSASSSIDEHPSAESSKQFASYYVVSTMHFASQMTLVDDQHYDEDSLHSHRLSGTDRLLQIHEECLKTSASSSIDEHPSAESSKQFASYYVVSTMHFASQMTLVDDQHYDEDSLHSHRLSGTDRLLQIHEECLKTSASSSIDEHPSAESSKQFASYYVVSTMHFASQMTLVDDQHYDEDSLHSHRLSGTDRLLQIHEECLKTSASSSIDEHPSAESSKQFASYYVVSTMHFASQMTLVDDQHYDEDSLHSHRLSGTDRLLQIHEECLKTSASSSIDEHPSAESSKQFASYYVVSTMHFASQMTLVDDQHYDEDSLHSHRLSGTDRLLQIHEECLKTSASSSIDEHPSAESSKQFASYYVVSTMHFASQMTLVDDQHYDEDSLHSHRLSGTDRLLQIHEECLKTSASSSIDEHPSAESSKQFASYYVVSTMHFASQMTLVDDQHYDEDSLHSHRLSGTDRLLQIHEECLKTSASSSIDEHPSAESSKQFASYYVVSTMHFASQMTLVDDQHYDEDSLHSHRLSGTDRLLQIHEECLKTSASSSIDEHPSAESSKQFSSYYVVSTMHFAS